MLSHSDAGGGLRKAVTTVYWRYRGLRVCLIPMDPTPFSQRRDAGSTLTILVVEDDARIRLQIAHHLTARGYMVLEADSADRALEILERDKGAIDCVFSDVQMPGRYDGVALARWILCHRPHLAVLLTSGN